MERKFAVVTTFHKAGYEKYGKRMINTFLENWPAQVELWVYGEDVSIDEVDDGRLHVLRESADLERFVNQWKDVPKANGDISGVPRLASRKDSHKPFKWQAIRFAHKVYAIFDCAKRSNADVLMWMDADTVCHSPLTGEKLEQLVPKNTDICYLGRQGKYSECGLYSMNLKSTGTHRFLHEFQRMYDEAEQGIFTLEEWHDSFVFDAVRKVTHPTEINWSSGIIKGEGHPLINCEWGAYLDHLKGDRKTNGRSLQKDLRVKRTEKYWQ
jgi:hypothetical protein